MKMLPGEVPGIRNDLLQTMRKYDLACVVAFHFGTAATLVGGCPPDQIITALRSAADQIEEQIKVKTSNERGRK